MAEGTTRFGVSIPDRLLERFDRAIGERGYSSRSEALRDLIRDYLVEMEWESNEETIGTITLVYDHHVKELSEELNSLQHDMGKAIISTLHVHLDHHLCLEVVLIKGRSHEIRRMADRLIGTKGVVHGKLTAATVGKSF